MATKPQTIRQQIMRNVRALKHDLLSEKQSVGAEKPEFAKYVFDRMDHALKDVDPTHALNELVGACADVAWEGATRGDDRQMRFKLLVDGIVIDDEITFLDESATTGYRTVLASFLTIRQHASYISLLEQKREQLDTKIGLQWKANATALHRSGGNPEALMVEHADQMLAAAE